ncbi:hypothetical protein [Chengkuizengella axinellae]|uniref:DUF2508 family protein n=1 Tax=Chengkuizengella axinellae TaxID=3064388 RepID=A0ABT9J5N1_9BACL|nr:hypothetical protein [Chengkuizengella sp. 2205SS18-9]MDP5276922.1 hypothetical protein [Chengkuizengella sp. 2205SS18-9]
MLGILFNDRETQEIDYLLRKELDEMLLDLRDMKLDRQMKAAIEARYKVIFRMYARLASPKQLSKYAITRKYSK